MKYSSDLDAVRAQREGWLHTMGVNIVEATEQEVIAEWTVDERHLQPDGVVTGGVHSGVIECLASIGGNLVARHDDRGVVGVESHTSFLRAVRAGGRLRAKAVPIHHGRRSHVWQGDVWDENGKLVATGRLRLLAIETGTQLAGIPIQGRLARDSEPKP